MHRLLLLALVFAVGAVSAQEVTLYPGHPDLDMSAITPSDVTQNVQMMEPEPRPLGLNKETARLDGDVLTLVSASDIALEGGTRIDSTRLSWPSLALLSQAVVRGNNRGQAIVTDTQLDGAYGGDGSEMPFAFPLSQPAFPAAALPFVIRALPLDQTGYEATATVFSPETRFKDIYLTVEEAETVTLSDGRVVESAVVRQVGGPNGVQRHYVDPDTRELLRTEIRAQGMVIRVGPVTADEVAAIQAADAAARAEAEAAREAAAQNQLMPGSVALVEVAPQTGTYAVLLTQPAEQDLGTIQVTETIQDGRLVTASDIQIPQAGQDQQDTTVVAYPSLEAISRVEIKPDEVERATFADGRMTGTVTGNGETVEVDADLEDAFAPGLTRHVVRSLPFAEGYTASFNQIDGDGEISTSFLSVTGQETYTRADGTETTVWIVVETEEGTPDYTYSVDTETRELLKMAFAPQPGVRVEIVAQ